MYMVHALHSENQDTVSTSNNAYGTGHYLLIYCSYKNKRHNDDDESYNYVMCFSADLAVVLGIGWLFEVCCQNTSECR
jgi:hypothetical protein